MTPTRSGFARPRATDPKIATAPSRRARITLGQESGFTIVETMVAMMLLAVAVLGTLSLMQGSLSSTRRTTAREQGTNLARDLVERSRQVAYSSMSMALAPTTLRAALPASDAATPLVGSTFSVKRRNVTYTVKVSACSIDDPTDGAGVGNATFCADPSAVAGSTPSPTSPAAAVNVLGIGVTLGGSLVDTVCKALGNPAILQTLTDTVSAVAPLSVCPSGTSAGSNVHYDTMPDDLRRVRVEVSWNAGSPESVTQTTLLTNPRL